MSTSNVDYTSFFSGEENDVELESALRPNSKQPPLTVSQAEHNAQVIEQQSLASSNDGELYTHEDNTTSKPTGNGGNTTRGAINTEPSTPIVDRAASNNPRSVIASFYHADDEQAEAEQLAATSTGEPTPGSNRIGKDTNLLLQEAHVEDETPDLISGMLNPEESTVNSVTTSNNQLDTHVKQSTIHHHDTHDTGNTQSASTSDSAHTSKQGKQGDEPADSIHDSASDTSTVLDTNTNTDDEEQPDVDLQAISKLEQQALANSKQDNHATSDNDESLPLPSPDGSLKDDTTNSKQDKKYIPKATKDYLLVAPGDTGGERFDIDKVLTDAVDRGASDVHIASNRPIKLRINGIMYKFAKYQLMETADMNELIINNGRLINKEMTQKFNTQRSVDTAYVIRTGPRHGERFRVHFAEEMNGTAIVFRHIRPEIFTPEEIGLTDDVVNWGQLSQGMILVTGPTGSGKSATLSSILRNVQLTRPGKIITLEEPIETVYPLDGVADIWQREVPENCPSFVRGIVDAMREDPDVILVGEIRDYATIQAAMQACNTGHLTFATIHANSAPDVITRVMDLAGDADKSELASNLARNLKGILSQRLLLKPSNDGRVAVREVIQVGRRQRLQIAHGDVDGMTADLRAQAADLDSQMLMMAIQGKVTLKSARSASMDRAGFDAMVNALSPRARGMIINDVDYQSSDESLARLG